MRILVTGAGGFIGSHLVASLKKKGHYVRGVDLKLPEFAPTVADEFIVDDLRDPKVADLVTRNMEDVYQLAADMGGMGFISCHHAQILHNNALINLNMIEAARTSKVRRYLYTSSACVYPEYRQTDVDAAPLKEIDVYPAMPQDAYGWEKLVTEQLVLHYRNDYHMNVRVVRFHNVYGPLGTWQGGREKAPAALSRKVATAKLTSTPEIEVWGDGLQTRSFMHIEDCLEGLERIMDSNYQEPLNLGRDDMISIDDLAYLIANIANYKIRIKHVPGPQGVRGRNSDNELCRKVLGWEPRIPLTQGLTGTYAWIEEQVRQSLRRTAEPVEAVAA
jgi:GDP-D-mannose 3', 5'-epimerase